MPITDKEFNERIAKIPLAELCKAERAMDKIKLLDCMPSKYYDFVRREIHRRMGVK